MLLGPLMPVVPVFRRVTLEAFDLFDAGVVRAKPEPQRSDASPFQKVGGARSPDLVCGDWVLDAKYKYPGGSPNRDDVNQMFVYGHVGRGRESTDRPPTDVALLYPATGTARALAPTDGARALGPRSRGFGAAMVGEPLRPGGLQPHQPYKEARQRGKRLEKPLQLGALWEDQPPCQADGG